VFDLGVPWIFSTSLSPLGISSKNVPPAWTGYPSITSDESIWEKHNKKLEEVFKALFESFTTWGTENGVPEIKNMNLPYWLEYSPYANIYMYPEELDYTSMRPNPPNWHRFDTFMRMEKENFELPRELHGLPGKLIYVSMGSIGCSELGLMRRLIAMLGHSPHRFIFSKGS